MASQVSAPQRAVATLLLFQGLDVDPVEPRHAVGLGPQRDFAGTVERAVGMAEQRLSVERDREAISLGAKGQRVPDAACDLGVGSRKFLAAAADNAKEMDVVLKRVRARDVVIIAIDQSNDHAAGLILLAGD